MPKDMLHLIEALAGEIYGELIALAGLPELRGQAAPSLARD